MRLTPADVHNVAFKKPSIGKRGYDEDEVDAFLDLIEAELSRLIEENNELNQQVAALQGQSAPAQQAPAVSDEGVQDFIEPAPVDVSDHHDHEAPAPAPVDEPVYAPPPAPVDTSAPAPHHVQAAKLLGLAQETAERLTGDAAREAEETRAAAKAESEKTLSDAKAEAERLLTEANNHSETTVNDADAHAEAAIRDATIRADALDREAQGKYSQVMGQLTEQRTTLEKKIDDLRIYEREYRTRLKSWISEQLSQLDDSGSEQPAESQQV